MKIGAGKMLMYQCDFCAGKPEKFQGMMILRIREEKESRVFDICPQCTKQIADMAKNPSRKIGQS